MHISFVLYVSVHIHQLFFSLSFLLYYVRNGNDYFYAWIIQVEKMLRSPRDGSEDWWNLAASLWENNSIFSNLRDICVILLLLPEV